MSHRIYFDHASSTQIHPEVLDAYVEVLKTYFANSASLYDEGRKVTELLSKSRASIAKLLGVQTNEIIYTSGASESNSSAIKGVCLANKEKKHIITTCVEHSSVMAVCEQMHRIFDYDITYLPVNYNGVVELEEVKKALREDTAIVSIMAVNNEVGAINPIEEIGEYIKKNSHAYFHVDMTQSIGKIDINLKNIDLASFSAHKIHGLKGSGILIKKAHVPYEPLIAGGEQEMGLRGGTTNAPTHMMLAKTLRLALENRQSNNDACRILQEYTVNKLLEIPGIEINHPKNNIPQLVNFSYEKIPSEVMQNALNAKGFMVSARSTCESATLNTSYVLKAMGYSDLRSSSYIRMSFSKENTKEEIDAFIAAIKETIEHYG